jgi:hypothetical protein
MLRIYDDMLEAVRLMRTSLVAIERRDPDLGRQLRRAASSVVLNLAEGSGSFGRVRPLVARRRRRQADLPLSQPIPGTSRGARVCDGGASVRHEQALVRDGTTSALRGDAAVPNGATRVLGGHATVLDGGEPVRCSQTPVCRRASRVRVDEARPQLE